MQDPHAIFERRREKFMEVIKRYRTKQLQQLHQNAEEEQNAELAKIKRDAQNKDQEVFRKMENNVKVAEKIFKSRKINQCRMSEMKIRFDMIEKVQEQTKLSLKNITKNQREYKQLLKGLIKQGLIKLLEEKVEVRCLKEEEGLVREVMTESQREFNEQCSVKTEMVIATANYLQDSDLGGVILTSFKGRIVCDNTLKARLSYCMQKLLPEIRYMLFHESDVHLSEQRKLKKQKQSMRVKA